MQVYFDVFCGAPTISDGNNMKFYPIPDWCKTEFGAIQRGWPATLNPAVDKKIPPRCPDPTWPLMRQYSDRHMVLYQEDKSNLYELINVGYKPDPNNPNVGTWHAVSGALFQPSTLAGLHLHQPPDPPWGGPTMCYMPISGGMVMLQELLDALANGQPLTHGFRAVFRATSDGRTYDRWVYPAGNTQTEFVCSMAMPAGARFRLKGGSVRPDLSSMQRSLPILPSFSSS